MAALGPCQASIIAMNNILAGNAPRVWNAGAVYALLDAQNRAIGEVPDPTSGRNDGMVVRDEAGLPTVKIRNYKRDTGATKTTPDCEATPVAHTEDMFKIQMYRQTSVRVPWQYMSSLCGEAAKVFASGRTPDGSQYRVGNTPIMADVAAQINSRVFKLVQDINKDVATKLGTAVGKNVRTGLTTPKNYTLFKANGEKMEDGYNELITDFTWNGFGGVPIIVGGAQFNKFANSMKWGNLAASGTDYSIMSGTDPFRFYADKDIDTLLGADQFLTLAPGSAKLVTYNEFGGIFTGTHGTGEFGQFTIPEFGDDLRFDLHVEKISCPKPHADFIISLYYDVYVPQNIFEAGNGTTVAADPQAGVNGVFAGKVVKAAA